MLQKLDRVSSEQQNIKIKLQESFFQKKSNDQYNLKLHNKYIRGEGKRPLIIIEMRENQPSPLVKFPGDGRTLLSVFLDNCDPDNGL